MMCEIKQLQKERLISLPNFLEPKFSPQGNSNKLSGFQLQELFGAPVLIPSCTDVLPKGFEYK